MSEAMTDEELKSLTKAIIAAVAEKNHQIVRDDDPIMVLPTALKLIVNQMFDNQKLALLEFRIEIHKTQKELAEKSKEEAEKISLDTLNTVKKMIAESVSAEVAVGCKKIRNVVGDEMKEIFSEYSKEFKELEHEVNAVSRSSNFAFYAAIIAFLGGIAAVVATALR